MNGESYDIRDLLNLASIPRVGANRLRMLVGHFGSPRNVLSASAIEIARVDGIDKKLASAIAHFKFDPAFVDFQLSAVNKVNGRIISIWDEEYPDLLRKIYDPPALLFLRGSLLPTDNYSIAVVGTRQPSAYGRIVAERFAQNLVKLGITTVSGLARGIDTIAHQVSISSGGRTVAIIGSSLDNIYPTENRALATKIEEHGSVISEFFMGTKTDPGNFPRRNRIISGMSLGTLIIETAENGGAMITGSIALDQNRELFCVPGNITEKRSAGTNRLIKNSHAKLVETVDDILEELGPMLRPIMKKTPAKNPPQVTMFEQKILEVLPDESCHIDRIAELSQMPISDTLVNLLGLEFKGLVKQMPGKMFLKI